MGSNETITTYYFMMYFFFASVFHFFATDFTFSPQKAHFRQTPFLFRQPLCSQLPAASINLGSADAPFTRHGLSDPTGRTHLARSDGSQTDLE